MRARCLSSPPGVTDDGPNVALRPAASSSPHFHARYDRCRSRAPSRVSISSPATGGSVGKFCPFESGLVIGRRPRPRHSASPVVSRTATMSLFVELVGPVFAHRRSVELWYGRSSGCACELSPSGFRRLKDQLMTIRVMHVHVVPNALLRGPRH